ncbi:MAG: molybdopterin-dependent oxidoreductase [Chloroflexi bacterium]|nr:molybdopterin-dependent oxidoreductase [Chloroflexota bacterium]
MSQEKKLTRRDVLKLAGVGGAVAAVLSGCGPMSRYVRRKPYTDMPEYQLPGESVYFATLCRECPAGCGLLVRTVEGRAIKVEGNPQHPVNRGRTCARAQASLQGLYDPDRLAGPWAAQKRGSRAGRSLSWDEAVQVVAQALQAGPGVQFLLGLVPDHLADLVSEIATALGAPEPIRFGGLALFEARQTLRQAMQAVIGQDALPHFDIANATFVLSFGANFMETWLSPVAFSRAYGHLRRGRPDLRGLFVQLEPRMSMTAASADKWAAVKPGTEGRVALAIGRLAAEMRDGVVPPAFDVDAETIAAEAGLDMALLEKIAHYFATSPRPLAIPGGAALAHTNGLETAQAILALNAWAGNFGLPGGVQVLPAAPIYEDRNAASLQDMADLVRRMKAGQVKALLVHGTNPVFELPAGLGFAEALEKVDTVISFSPFYDETAAQADYIFPDHTPLESWGYQKARVGTDRMVVTASQPVVVPLYDTKATADVLLAAAQAVGGEVAEAVPYQDEVDFLQQALANLMDSPDGIYTAVTPKAFWGRFLQHGGWWTKEPAAVQTFDAAAILQQPLEVPAPQFDAGEFHLVVYPHPILGDGAGANRPWLQETPEPMTTVMWNSWVEVNPETARELGLRHDDIVEIRSPYGRVYAAVYVYPGIRPDTVALAFGQGHEALGRWAEGRGVNPAKLLGPHTNAAGDLAWGRVRVSLRKTGRRRPLARKEHLVGVYGDGVAQ